MSFVKPIKYGKLDNEKNDIWTYKPEPSDVLIAPVDGKIHDILPDKDGGTIKLDYEFDGNKYVDLVISGIGPENLKNVSNNQKVKKGDKITKCGKDNLGNEFIKFQIKDVYNNNIPIASIFNSNSSSSKKEEDKNKSSKKEKSKENDGQGYNKPPEDSKKFNWNRTSKELPDLFTSILLTPWTMLDKAFTDKDEQKEEKLMEEIKRIKQLLK
jgi:hypothetical protein